MKNPEELHFPEEHFHTYLDGELSHSERDVFDEHLKTCLACQGYLQTLASLFKQIESLPEVEIGRDLSAIVTRQISPSGNRSLGWNIALATQALASGLLFWFAWPLIEPLFQVIREFGWQVSKAETVRMISQQIDEFNQAVIPFFEQISAQFSGTVQTFDIVLADSLVVPLLVSATILWVIGNGLLLGERKIIR